MAALDFLLDPSWLASLPRFVVPILLAALGGALCERAGVFNIALEGFVLVGAFAAVAASWATGSAGLGTLGAVAAGVAFGLLFAEGSVRRGGDAIVVSVALNLLAVGLTGYLLRALFGAAGAFRDPAIVPLPGIDVGPLGAVPVLGPLFSGQSPLLLVALLAVPAIHLGLARHRLGLRLRAAGEHPDALTVGGVSVARVRTLALVGCGALCGLAGAQLSLSNVTLFVEGMSAGRGWIAVVAVLLSRGRPWPLFAVAVLFGAADSAAVRLQGAGLAQQASDALPYLVTLAALTVASLARRRAARVP